MSSTTMLKPSEVWERMRLRHQTFATSEEIAGWLGCEPSSVTQRLRRQRDKKLLMSVANGAWVASPYEKRAGWADPYHYIDALMKHHNTRYHVTTRIAGRFYGATHQPTRRIAVVAEKPIRDRWLAGTPAGFLYRRDLSDFPTQTFQVWDRGIEDKLPLVVASRELLIFESVFYRQHVGGLDHLGDIYAGMLMYLNDTTDPPVDSVHWPIDSDELARVGKLFPYWVRQYAGHMLDWCREYVQETYLDMKIELDTDPLRATMPAMLEEANIDKQWPWPQGYEPVFDEKWRIWRHRLPDLNIC